MTGSVTTNFDMMVELNGTQLSPSDWLVTSLIQTGFQHILYPIIELPDL